MFKSLTGRAFDRVLRWLDDKLPASFYRDKLPGWIWQCESTLSLGRCLNKAVDKCLGRNVAWTSEVYQILWLAVEALSLISFAVEWFNLFKINPAS